MSKVLGKEMTEIGKRIRDARKRKGLTQTEFGNLIGKSLRAVQLYEKGQTDLSVGLLIDIAKKLDIEPSSLVSYQKPDVKTDTLSDVLEAFFQIYDLQSLKYDIEVHRPPHSETWKCGVVFQGKCKAEHNADFCLALESFHDELIEFESGHHSREKFEQWKETMLTYYSACTLK